MKQLDFARIQAALAGKKLVGFDSRADKLGTAKIGLPKVSSSKRGLPKVR